jgi:hypothetical protein
MTCHSEIIASAVPGLSPNRPFEVALHFYVNGVKQDSRPVYDSCVSAILRVPFGLLQAMERKTAFRWGSSVFQDDGECNRRHGSSRFELLGARVGETLLAKTMHPSTLDEE